MVYKTRGVCAREIHFDIENDIIQKVTFIGGCAGNTSGISSLVKGMHIDDVIARLKGIDCNFKGTSCPDQLATALMLYKANK
ncbi:MAG: TIGR03905 family TSCPD domain-containing protein [Lachnospiraceae bacterium]